MSQVYHCTPVLMKVTWAHLSIQHFERSHMWLYLILCSTAKHLQMHLQVETRVRRCPSVCKHGMYYSRGKWNNGDHTDGLIRQENHVSGQRSQFRTSFYGSGLTALRTTINTSPSEISKTMTPPNQDTNMRFFKIPIKLWVAWGW